MTLRAGARVVVTGAAGYIGGALAELLVAEGARVHATDLRPCTVHGVVESHVADVTDAEDVARSVSAADPEFVFHLAGFKDRSNVPDAFRAALAVNVGGTANLLEACADRPALRAFVTLGTCEEYGDAPAPFRESTRERPVTAYGASKVAATHLCQFFRRAHGVPAVVLRPTVVYGPGQPPDMFLPALVAALARGERFPMTPGEQTRDFVHVDDLIDAILLAATTEPARGSVINVGGGEPVLIREVARRVARLLNAEDLLGVGDLPYRDGENMDYRADATLAHELLGWEPQVSLADGLARVVEASRG